MIEDFHDMEMIEGDVCLRKRGFHSSNVSRPHITADLLDLARVALVRTQVAGKRRDGFLISPLGTIQKALCVEIEEQADVIVSPEAGGFIHTDALHSGEIRLPAGFLDMMVEHTPDAGVVLANHSCYI